MKKVLIIVGALIVVAAVALYLFVFSKDGEKPEVRVEYPLEVFTTNINGSDGRYLKATLALILNSDDTALTELLIAHTVRVRDTIIFILRDLTVEDLSAAGTQEELKTKILTELNLLLGIDNIVEVRFNDFVMA